MRAVRAAVLLDSAAGTLDVVADMQIVTAGRERVTFALQSRHAVDAGFRVRRIRQAADDCRFEATENQITVELQAQTQEAHLEMSYVGSPGDTGDFINPQELMLRGEAGWLPTIAGSNTAFDVTVSHAAGFRLFGQGALVPQEPTPHGLVRERWRHDGEDFTLYGAAEYRTRTERLADTELIVAAWPRDEAQLEPVAGMAEHVLEAYETLGRYPFPRIQIVEGSLTDGYGGYGALSNISLGWRTFQSGGDLQFLAHELAHAWFGGVVLGPRDGAGTWTEPMAEYVSTWALTESERAQCRAEWTAGYDAIDHTRDVALVDVTWDHGWEVYNVISYMKGPLVLAELEQKIGLEGMQQSLRRFIHLRRGRTTQWSDFVAVVRETQGDAHADWLLDELAYVKA